MWSSKTQNCCFQICSKSIDKNKVVRLGKKEVSHSKIFFFAQNAWIYVWNWCLYTGFTLRSPNWPEFQNLGSEKSELAETVKNERDFWAHFWDVFGRCSRVPRHSPTKFKHRIALLSGYYLLKFQPKRSTGGRDRSRGVSQTERVFLAFFARFCK